MKGNVTLKTVSKYAKQTIDQKVRDEKIEFRFTLQQQVQKKLVAWKSTHCQMWFSKDCWKYLAPSLQYVSKPF